jgi:hypothetical protein
MTFKPATDLTILAPAGSGDWHQEWAEGEVIRQPDRVILRTNGQGQALRAGVELRPALHLGQQNLVIQLRVDSLADLQRLELRLAAQAGDRHHYVSLPISFLGDPEANFLQPGEWSSLHLSLAHGQCYPLSEFEAEAPMTYLQVMLEDRGGQPVEVQLGAIAAQPRPQRGCISLHFDDGYWHHGQQLPQLLQAHSTPQAPLKATAFLMPRHLNQPGHLSLADSQRLAQDHGWELGAHHSQPLTTMAPADLAGELGYTLEVFQTQGWAQGPVHFAYPLGKMNRPCRRALTAYFASGRLISGGPETLPPADWYRLRAINVTPLLSAQDLADLAQRAVHHGAWAIYMFHHIVDQPRLLTEYARSELESFLAFLRDQGYGTTAIADLYGSRLTRPDP